MSDAATITHVDRSAGVTHADRSASVSHADRSASIAHAVADQAGIDPDAQAYIDRVEADGGTVHDKEWVDTVITTLKGLGVYSDVVFLGDANMGTDVSSTGSDVGILYDASGNKNDATQTDSAKKPTLTTNSGLDSKNVGAHDASDDFLSATIRGVSTTESTFVTVFAGLFSSDSGLLNVDDGALNDSLSLRVRTSDTRETKWRISDGSSLSSIQADVGADDGGGHVVVGRAASPQVLRVDGSEVKTATNGLTDVTYSTVHIGILADESTWAAEIDSAMSIVIDANVSDSDISSLEGTINDYYSAY